jgi:GT2 family glycosyltransferase
MYGDGAEARRCLESLAGHTAGAPALYLVDNASPPGALRALEEGGGRPENVTLLPQEKNLGFGAGHNVVLPLLQSEYHAVVNPDILLHGDALNAMADWMDRHPDVVIAIPRLVFPGGRVQNLGKRRPALLPLLARQTGWPFLKKYERRYLMLDGDLTRPVDVQFCSGSFFLIRTAVFRAIGGFDEKYFMYVEDADITMKALGHGRAVYLPGVTVEHAWHRAAHRSVRPFVWQARGMLRYWRKWGFRLT